jgi:chromosome segregation ATPase
MSDKNRTTLAQRLRADWDIQFPTPKECADELDRLQRELAEAQREVAFLHVRRGELVIERDRYKAALGEYPEGRDVILAALLAERSTRERELAYHREQELRLANEVHRVMSELASAQAELAYARSTGDECALEVDGLRKGLAEAREGIREVMDDHATTLERLDEARELLSKTAEWLRDPRWGTWPYMEGSEVYDDKANAIEAIDAFLAAAKEGER